MLDESSVSNVLGERTHFLDKVPSNFNFLDVWFSEADQVPHVIFETRSQLL